jgi:hypothetical protein
MGEAHVDGNSRGFRTPPLVDDHNDTLAGVQVVLDLELPVIPCIGPLGVELRSARDSGVELLVRPIETGHVPDEIGTPADFTGGQEVHVAAPNDLDVLLRHRPSSIPPAGRTDVRRPRVP